MCKRAGFAFMLSKQTYAKRLHKRHSVHIVSAFNYGLLGSGIKMLLWLKSKKGHLEMCPCLCKSEEYFVACNNVLLTFQLVQSGLTLNQESNVD